MMVVVLKCPPMWTLTSLPCSRRLTEWDPTRTRSRTALATVGSMTLAKETTERAPERRGSVTVSVALPGFPTWLVAVALTV